MTLLTQHIISLSETIAEHDGVGHWAISRRVSSKGDFIHRLMMGGDCSTRTYEATMRRFSEIWPNDLEWPAAIPRPIKSKSKGAA